MNNDLNYKYETKTTKNGIVLVKLLQISWHDCKRYSEIWIPKDSIVGYASGYNGDVLITNVLFSHFNHSSNLVKVEDECWKAVVKNLFE